MDFLEEYTDGYSLVIRRRRMIKITIEEAEEIVAFVKMHEREEISDEMWEVVLKLQDLIEEETQ